jgi:hypothetical protein
VLAYSLKGVVEVDEPAASSTEMIDWRHKTSRAVLVDVLRAFHSQDPAWLLPARLEFRTSDSSDMKGSYGQVVRAMRWAPKLWMWSRQDHYGEAGADQAFDEEGRRVPVQFEDWAKRTGQRVAVRHFPIAFPPWVHDGTWGREGPRSE